MINIYKINLNQDKMHIILSAESKISKHNNNILIIIINFEFIKIFNFFLIFIINIIKLILLIFMRIFSFFGDFIFI